MGRELDYLLLGFAGFGFGGVAGGLEAGGFGEVVFVDEEGLALVAELDVVAGR